MSDASFSLKKHHISTNTNVIASSSSSSTSHHVAVLLVTVVVSLAFLVQGYLLFTSSLLTYNEVFVSSFTFKDEQEYDTFSLRFMVIFLFGEAVGALMYIPSTDFLSRRMAMGMFALSSIGMIGWTALAGSIQSLLYSRFFLGVSLAPVLCTVPIYVGETSHRSQRGKNLTITYIALIVGCVVGTAFFVSRHDCSGTEFLPHTARIRHHEDVVSLSTQRNHLPSNVQVLRRRLQDHRSSSMYPLDQRTSEENLVVNYTLSQGNGYLRSTHGFDGHLMTKIPNGHDTYKFWINLDNLSLEESWRGTCLFPVMPLLVMILALLTCVPESPRWLLHQQQVQDAYIALTQARRDDGDGGTTIEIENEFTEMQHGLSNKYGRQQCGYSAMVDLVKDGAQFRRCLFCMLFNVSQPLVGSSMLYFFTDELTDILGMHSSVLVIILGLFGSLVGSLVAYHHVDFWGRRFLMLGGTGLICISWVFAAVCVNVGELENGSAEAFETSRILSFLFGDMYAMAAFAYALSLGPLCISMPVEMFALESRSTAVCLSYCGSFLSTGLFTVYLGLYMQMSDHIAIQHDNRKDAGEPETERRYTTSFYDILQGCMNILLVSEPSHQYQAHETATTTNSSSAGDGNVDGNEVFFSYGLVGYLLLFVVVSFMLWLLSYMLLSETKGLHLEDVDMYLTDKTKLLAYKRELRQTMTASKPLLGNGSHKSHDSYSYNGEHDGSSSDGGGYTKVEDIHDV